MPYFMPSLAPVISDIYFPDAYVYSTKLRTFDLFRAPYFACYSYLSLGLALSKLRIYRRTFAAPVPFLLPHPVVLVHDYLNIRSSESRITNLSKVLFILPKSAPTVERSFEIEEISSIVDRLRLLYNEVNVLIYHKDIELESFCGSLSLFDNIFCAGNRQDPLFYPRLISIYSLHSCIASPSLDVSLLYSAIANRYFLYAPMDVQVSRSSIYQASRLPSSEDMRLFYSVASDIQPYKQFSSDKLRIFYDAPFTKSPTGYSVQSIQGLSPTYFFRFMQLLVRCYDRIIRTIAS